MRRRGAAVRRAVVGVALGVAMVAAGDRAAAADATVHGLLDLVAAGHTVADDRNVQYFGVSPFDAYQLRIFVDGNVSDRLQVHTQLLFTEAIGARPLGAYVTATPWESRDLHVIAGLIPWYLGTYAEHSYSDKNPLIGAPMLYQRHTTLRWESIPANADQLLALSGQGDFGVSYTGGFRVPGMPIIYSDWWDFGVGVVGSARPWEFSLAAINGTPGWPYPTRDENTGKGFFGRVGLAPTPGTRFGVSGSYGPYLVDDAVAGSLPPGASPDDYHQILGMADAEWSMGHVSLRGEAYHNTWETPTVGDLKVKGLYAEGKVGLPAGFYAAARYEIMRFSDLADSTGASHPWDRDVDRGEAGVGYRMARNALAKVAFQWNREKADDPGEKDYRYDLLAGQLSLRF